MILTSHPRSNNIQLQQKIKAIKSKAKGQKKQISLAQHFLNSSTNLKDINHCDFHINSHDDNNPEHFFSFPKFQNHQKSPLIRYIQQSSSKEPKCPWTKQCFQKTKHLKTNESLRSSSNLNCNSTSTLQQKSIRLRSSKKSSNKKEFSMPKYKYKSEQDQSQFSKISSQSQNQFLKVGQVRKEKIPVNIFALQSVINGSLSNSYKIDLSQTRILNS